MTSFDRQMRPAGCTDLVYSAAVKLSGPWDVLTALHQFNSKPSTRSKLLQSSLQAAPT